MLRSATVCLGFLALLYFAVDTLVRAIQHRGYYFSFRGSTGFGSSSAPPPSLGDAAWVFALGPGLQLAVAALVAIGVRRRPSLMVRLRVITWWLLALDIALVLFVATHVAYI